MLPREALALALGERGETLAVQARTTTTGVSEIWSSLWGTEPTIAPLIGLSP